MSTLKDLVSRRTSLGPDEIEKLQGLLGVWQLVADLSFADLLLWCRLAVEKGFVCVGQMRPYTAQTLYPEDVFGRIVRPEELPIIDRAFAEGRSWQRDEPLLIDGVEVRMEAIPVPHDESVIAVMTKEGAPLSRRAGRLEHHYLQCAAAFSRMIQDGTLPFAGEGLDPELSPRVGDGLIRLDAEGRVLYASPNAVSAYRRLGIVSNLEGERLEDLEVKSAPASTALTLRAPAEGEIEASTTVVLQRAIPFLEGPPGPAQRITGGIVLVRDVTELRHRERMLQLKEAVIQEIHHRVKNNLQTVASLLRIQARRMGSSEAKEELDEAVR
ncbi:MAG: histidine kinase N-terminal domain-containing protein, partial [Actinomycetota bacterium]